jgi:4-hydroxy-4-methyl-2-oxoglutarate aldolase
MIEEPPILTVRRSFQRPSSEALAALAGTPSGHLVDAQGGRGALDYRIKPLEYPAEGPGVFAGPAVTCHAGPADNLAVFGALELSRPGDVIVIATDGFTGTCVIGDLLCGMMRNRGVAAVVTDGLARDAAGIRATGLPVFCAGISPNSPAASGPGTAGLPVSLGGVAIDAGDVLVADRDGVVLVPRASIDEVLAKLAEVRAAETELEAKVEAGLELPEFARALLASDRVRYVD